MAHKHIKAITAMLLATVTLTTLTSCDQNNGFDVTEDDLPYGATITVNKKDYILPVQYDHRFINEELLNTVLRYYYAIQTDNVEMFTQIQHPLYMQYQLDDVLGGKYTNEDILDNSNEALRIFNDGKDYVFSFIDITDCVKGTEYTTSATLLEILDNLSEEADGSKISKDISQFYELTVTRYFADKDSCIKGETDKAMYDEKLFAFECKDEWFIIYN